MLIVMLNKLDQSVEINTKIDRNEHVLSINQSTVLSPTLHFTFYVYYLKVKSTLLNLQNDYCSSYNTLMQTKHTHTNSSRTTGQGCIPGVVITNVTDPNVHCPIGADEHLARRSLHQGVHHCRNASAGPPPPQCDSSHHCSTPPVRSRRNSNCNRKTNNKSIFVPGTEKIESSSIRISLPALFSLYGVSVIAARIFFFFLFITLFVELFCLRRCAMQIDACSHFYEIIVLNFKKHNYCTKSVTSDHLGFLWELEKTFGNYFFGFSIFNY